MASLCLLQETLETVPAHETHAEDAVAEEDDTEKDPKKVCCCHVTDDQQPITLI